VTVDELEFEFTQEDLQALIDSVKDEPTPSTVYTIEVSDDDDEFVLETVCEWKGIEPEAALLLALKVGLSALWGLWEAEHCSH